MPHCGYYLKDIRVWDDGRGYALGDKCLFYTRDSGKSWNVSTIQPGRYPNIDAVPLAVDFQNENTGWLNFSDGSVFRTVTGGRHWLFVSHSELLESQQSEVVLRLLDQRHGIAVSRKGAVYESFDASKTWLQIPAGFSAVGVEVFEGELTWITTESRLYSLASRLRP